MPQGMPEGMSMPQGMPEGMSMPPPVPQGGSEGEESDDVKKESATVASEPTDSEPAASKTLDADEPSAPSEASEPVIEPVD